MATGSTAAPLLEVNHVTKRYGGLAAVNDVSMRIEPGEIFALLGPNGAGKTTLIGCVTGLKMGFEGYIRVAGYDVVDDYRITRRLVGLVPQELNFDAFFSVRDVLQFQSGYFGIHPDKTRVDELLEIFSLTDKADANSRWLSGGMKRRMMICKALVHDPVLLFLDEPTAGVDVELREELWEYVLKLRERGTTIVLTTHYIEEAERLADRIGFLRKGQLLRVADRDALMDEYNQQQIVLTLARPQAQTLAQTLAQTQVVGLDRAGMRLVAQDERTLAVGYSADAGDAPINRLMRALVEHDAQVVDISTRKRSLEDIFRTIMDETEAAR
ncbi:MAG: ABC transporter ATP-binding protein [Myxococcota bacterium]